MDSLVSHQQHPHPAAYNQFAIQVDAFAPSSSSSSRHAYASSSSSSHSRLPSSSASSSQQQQQHQQQQQLGSALQIQTATPAPHEHEPEEQTAHPSRSGAFPDRAAADMPSQPQEQADSPPQQQQSIADALTDNPGPYGGLSRPLTLQERELLEHLDRLKFFLATAPSRWNASSADPSSSSSSSSAFPDLGLGLGMGVGFGGMPPAGHPHSAHPALNRFLLPNQEYVSCVLWGGLYHITGTDIVRALVFRFEAFGRPVRNMKKFEEGVFSDLRNLKPGVDACLEEPKSPFLDLLFKYQCIRTQKKQKVFYWFSVPHDRLFLDALERDLKREKMGLEPTTIVVGEPALSFTYDPKRSLYEQFSKVHGAREGEGELEAAVRRADEARASSTGDDAGSADGGRARSKKPAKKPSALSGPNSPFFPMFSLFEGSPTYKQRRKKVPKGRKSSPTSDGAFGGGMYAAQAYREPHLDRFGRDVVRLSAQDMFAAGARGEFGANPDIVVNQKERQRRAMEAQAHEFAAASASAQGRPFGAGLSGPGVAGGVEQQGVDMEMEMEMVYGISGSSVAAQGQQTASTLAGSLDYAAPQAQQQQQQYEQAQAMHSRPHIEQRHTYPLADFATHAHLRSGTDPFPHALSNQQQLTAPWSEGAAQPAMGLDAPRTRAFVCPLFSCGRMFKRMEHLRRHLRTHTLERPFQCEQCQKRFSRSDNLAQHMRTHDRRAAAAAVAGMGGMGVGVNGIASMNGLGVNGMEMAGMGMAVGVPDGAEGDAEDDLETDDLDGELQYMSGVRGITSVQMCEVEVQGQVHEVQGDEEGLLTTTAPVALTGGASAPAGVVDGADTDGHSQQLFYDASGQILRASPETSPYLAPNQNQPSPDAQWASVPSQPAQSTAPSSAFSATGTVTGLHLANNTAASAAAARMDASYHTGAMGDYVTSISAPSHKLTFDHAALYPPELALNGPGPIRRHRSATPSVPRYGESIRRPYSAALSDSGNSNSGANGSGGAPAPRSYHPYAIAGHHHAPASHSAQSSPMAYTVPLGAAGAYDASAAPVRHPGHSRSSSSGQLQDQMRQMLLEQQHQQQFAAVAAQETYAGMYRTDSPMPYGGEAYDMEMAHQHQHQQHQHQQSVYGQGLVDQYAAHQQQQQHSQPEYYQHSL
ncbi:hypothetical protein C8Q77DRAFT_1278921 [Trametes polyzona]|nr:hypothetical protein C8Q77DRAFT_1278921 [Trametes polyzona]